MRRIWILLLVIAIVAPAELAWAYPVLDACQDEGACGNGGACDFDCVLCACCVHRSPSVTTSFATSPPEELPASPASPAQSEPQAPPPSDILHVPKSH